MSHAIATQTSDASDNEIAARVLGGDRAVFAVLVRRHNQRLYRACRAVLRDDQDSEDAVQAAWIKVYRHLASFRGDSAFSTWITRIAVHEASDRLKQRKQHSLVAIEEVTVTDERTPEHATSDAELGRVFERHLDDLPDGLRSVLLLRDVLELDTKETADCLGISDEAVRVRLHRGRQALANMIDAGLANAWKFDGERCDRMLEAVMREVMRAP